MSKQTSKDRKPMPRKTSNYGNSTNRSTNPVGEMEGWDYQWAEQYIREEEQWHDDTKNYLGS